MRHALHSTSVRSFFPTAGESGDQSFPKGARGHHKQVVIMDEVDGMSAGDRGGIAELTKLIKTTQVPIICICNDRSSPKIRTLANYCLDLHIRRYCHAYIYV